MIGLDSSDAGEMIGANPEDAKILALAAGLVVRQGRAADDRDWPAWLACFAEDCEFWIPTWRGDGLLSSDPTSELSHIYYDDKAALEDRIIRLRSNASPANSPPPRTTHMYSGFELVDRPREGVARIRCSWTTMIFEPFTRQAGQLFGYQEHDITFDQEVAAIARKKVILQNDYLRTMVDVQMF